MDNKLLILGAGGTAKAIIEALDSNAYSQIALLDNFKFGGDLYGYPIIGKCDDFRLFRNDFSHAFVAMMNNEIRMGFIDGLVSAGYVLPVIISASAYVSKSAEVGFGTFINANGVIQSSSSLGIGCIIGSAAVVEHDNRLDKGVSLGPGASTTGGVAVGEGSFIGVGARISNNVSIGKGSIVAAGSAVISDVPDCVMVAGVPAVIKKGLPCGIGSALPF